MLNIKLLAAFIILTMTKGYCQNKIENGKTEIHKSVLKALKKEVEKFAIYPRTKKNSLSNFDFAGGGRGLDTLSNRTSNKREWLDFIKKIDTALIADYPLNLHHISKKRNKQLIFAPVIFSKGNDKALCISKTYSLLSQTGQATAWYFENEKEIWVLKDVQPFLLIN